MVRLRPTSLLSALLLGALTLPVGAARAAPPERIVSLNVCVDQILLDLVPRERLAALTHLATDPLTVPYPERARGLPTTRGAAEEVLMYDPDLIIAGAYTTTATVSLLQRLGRRVVVVSQPETLEGIVALVRDLATLVEQTERGEAMIHELQARLAAVRRRQPPSAGSLPAALVYQVNSFVGSSGSLIDQALALAGFRNIAVDLGATRSGRVDLEALVAHPPDLLILASSPSTYRSTVGDNLRHPALAKISALTRIHVLPWQSWLCGTHHIADTIEQLATLRAAGKPRP